MLDKIIHFSIQNKLIIGLLTLALIIWGSYSLKQLPIDAVPDITNNQAQILTVSPSLAAQEIERLVTFPVEQTMSTIPGIVEVRSMSRFGLSIVTLVFEDKVDIYWARQQVSERLNEAKNKIPAGVGNPELAPVTTGLGEIYQYTLHAKKGYEKKFDATELRSIQDWIVKRQLLGVPGIAEVSSFGGFVKQYEIALNPSRLLSMNISMEEIFSALEKNNQNTGGAYIDKNPNVYFIRSEGLIESIKDIEAIVIKNNSQGIPVLIRDVANVQIGHANRYGAMTYNDKGEVVGGLVLMLKGENSNKVITKVKERITQIQKSLPEGVVIEPFLDRSLLVNRAISTVEKNLLEGALIVVFVLVLFLGNIRAGLVVASVIPLAMLFAISMMYLFGVSGNLMSLGAIDFGLIVDGAVIIVEATLHHLALRKGLQLSQAEMDDEVYTSAKKIRSSAAFGEIIILIVYLPILALAGVEGKMFGPMAQTVSFAILGAFILSLTYVPMISSVILSKKIAHKKNFSDKMMDFFHRIYDPLIHFALKRRVMILSATFLLFIITVVTFIKMGGEFMPTLEEGDFAVETRVLTGSSMEKTIEAATKASKILKEQFPEVKLVVGKIGSSEIPTDPMPIEACDLMIILKDKSEWTSASSREELTEKMSIALQDIPGVSFGFQQPIQMRFNELMSGARQDVAIKIFGEDLNILTQLAKKISKIVKATEGAQDLYVEEVSGLPQIVIRYQREKMAQFGVSIQDINRVVQSSFAGQVAGIVYEGEKRFDLVLRLDKNNRNSLEDVQNLFITTGSGNQIPINQVADINIELGPNQIQREDAKRRLTIGFNVRGRDVESIVKEIEANINSNVSIPPGYFVKFGGQFENLIDAKKRLSIAVPVALILILLLLYFTFKSVKQSLLIFTAIPLSAIGGVFALIARGMPFSISAGVGFIALFGVAVLNGIVLIAEFNRLKKEGMEDLQEIILTGTKIRLRPVLMTAMVASLGFIPMAISSGAGGEVQKPLATVVIGGLISATFLTLVVLPLLYIYFEKGIKIKASSTLVTLLFLFGFSILQAQEFPVLTREQCIEEALKNNPTLLMGRLEIERYKVMEKTSTEIGKTNVLLTYGQYNGISAKDNNITVNQSIPFPTVMHSNLNYHRSQTKSSELSLKAKENEIKLRVNSCYEKIEFLFAQQALLTNQDSIFAEFFRAANLRFIKGEGTLLEKTTAESKWKEVQNLRLQNQYQLSIFLAEMHNILNKSANVVTNDFKKLELNLHLQDSTLLENNPLLLYFKQQIDLANKNKQVEKNKMYPDLTVGYFNQTLIGVPTNSGLASSSDRFQGIQLGVGVPLWFAPYAAKTKAAKISTKISQSNFEAEQNNLEIQYQQLFQEYLTMKSVVDFYEKSQIPNSKLISSQSQKAFNAGEIGYFEHSQNLSQSLLHQLQYLEKVHQYNLTIYQIQFLTSN